MAQALDTLFCYSCDRLTNHETRYMSGPSFIGKLLVSRECGEIIKEPVGGRASDCSNIVVERL